MTPLSRGIFFLFLFLLPLQTVWILREVSLDGSKWEYGTIGIFGTDVVLLLFMVTFLGERIFSWKRNNPRSFSFSFLFRGVIAKGALLDARTRIVFGSLVALLVWSALSILWAEDTVLAGYFFVKMLFAAGVFFVARSLRYQFASYGALILFAGAVLESMLGLWQFLLQDTIRSTIFGMSHFEVWRPGVSVLKNESGRWLRAYGSLPHPNILGGFLASTLIFGLFFLSGARTKTQRITIFISTFFVALGVLVTFSRSAWLGVFLGVIALSFGVFRWGESAQKKHFALSFLLIMCALLPFLFLFRETIFPRFDSKTIEREGSISERITSLYDAKEVLSRGDILMGVGVGNFTNAVHSLHPTRPIWSVQPAHNVFLLVTAEGGVPGVILFLLFLISATGAILSVGKTKNLEKRLLSLTFFCAFVALLPSFFLDHFLWTAHFGMLLLFFLLGVVSKSEFDKGKEVS